MKNISVILTFLANCNLPSYDIFIMVDGSIANNVNFTKVKQFLVNFVSAANISPSESHLGLLQFSLPYLASLEIGFRSSQVKNDILGRIGNMDYQEGSGRYTGKALEAVESRVGKSLFFCLYTISSTKSSRSDFVDVHLLRS